jgi:peptidoglycan/xylan/chitin deacetylase (PgdA/CDA1 family)
MKKMKKTTAKKIQQALNAFVVLLMMIQLSAPGMIALASNVPPSSVSGDSAPVEKTTPAVDAVATDPAPATDPVVTKVTEPVVDTKVPTVTDTTKDPAPVTGIPSVADPKKASTETTAPVPAENGDLNTIVAENVKADTVDLAAIDPEKTKETAELATDKADYAPTDTAIITGTGFIPGKTYTLIISSNDTPPVTSEVEVTADENGQFVYAYQLDGKYRPNYKVKAKNDEGTVIASTTFTDSNTSTLFPIGQGNYTAWNGTESNIDETGTPSCSTFPSNDYIDSNVTGNRESVNLDLSSIANGATITGVDVSVWYSAQNTNDGGTFKTFARLDNVDTDASADLVANGTSSSCSHNSTQTIDVADVVKSGTTNLQIGVVKTATDTSTVRVGAIRAVVTYTAVADTTPPSVAINQSSGQTDPTSASPVNFTVVFSESVADFATGDVTLSGTAGATTANVTGSGTTYNVAVSGMTASGTVIAAIAAGKANDAAGNDSLASTSTDNTVTYNLPPTTLIVNKVVVNDNSGTKVASDFSFTLDAGAPVAFLAGGSNSLTVSAGTHSIAEPTVAGYTATFGNSLNSNANCNNLNIPVGGTITCTITNDDNAPDYVPVTGNVIGNPSFEAGSGNNATSWSTNSDGVTAAFSITGSAHSGSRAAKIQVTADAGGDAKWAFSNFPVTPGQYYTFTDWYKSTVATEVDIFYTGGSTPVQFVGTLPVAATWTKYETSFVVPSGVTSVTVSHVLADVGTLTTDDYSMVPNTAPIFKDGGMVSLTFDDGWKSFFDNGAPVLNAANLKATAYINSQPIQEEWQDYMNSSNISALYAAGHDIGAHSSTHISLVGKDSATLQYEIDDNRNFLKGILGSAAPVDSFAYPFGDYDDTVINAVKAAGFVGARTVEQGNNFTNTDKYKLKAQEVNGNTTVAEVKGWIDLAKSQNAWLILLFHDVKNGDCANNAESYCTNKATLQEIVNYLVSQRITVPTMSQGMAVMGGSSIPDTIAPALAQVTPVVTPTNDSTPDYIFSSTEAGTIIYGGSCTSTQTTAVAGNNTVTFNALVSGIYSNCTVKVKDAANNTSVTLSVSPFTVDITAPVITLVGVNPQNIVMGEGYTELGATTDDGSPVTINATAFVDAVGAYTITYDAVDAIGNHAVQKTRTVNVFDKNSPVIASHGDETAEATSNAGAIVTYTLPATSDANDGDGVAACGPASGSKFALGETTVTCTASDLAGNKAIPTTFKVTVVDTTAPVIALNGSNPFTLTAGESYIEMGATASDAVDGSTEAVIGGDAVNTSTAGTYVVKYSKMDSHGNVATEVTRVVNVLETKKPAKASVSSNTPSLNYSLKKNSKRSITFTFSDLRLTNKKYVKIRLNGRIVTVSRVRISGNNSLVTVKLKYGKWPVGSYNLTMSYKNQINVPYIDKKGKTKYRKGWESGNVNEENILTII